VTGANANTDENGHASRLRRRSHRNPANVALHDHAGLGARAADRVTKAFGSWGFLIAQTIIIVVWITLNVVGAIEHWDTYPFILLNLLFSTQAAYAAPLILLSSNRSSEHDRLRAEVSYTRQDEMLTQLADMHDRLEVLIGSATKREPSTKRSRGEREPYL
jgi:uncharacterized membrane protein